MTLRTTYNTLSAAAARLMGGSKAPNAPTGLDDGMKAKAEKAKIDLQAIYDNPRPGVETAFKESKLAHMSQPKEWDNYVALFQLFGYQQYKHGFEAMSHAAVESMQAHIKVQIEAAFMDGAAAGALAGVQGLVDKGWCAPDPDAKSPTDISFQLRAYAANPGYSHNDYADVMRRAADECERFHGGMIAWKKTAHEKDAELIHLSVPKAMKAATEQAA